jgi:adenine-specific DNA-methyltransferase
VSTRTTRANQFQGRGLLIEDDGVFPSTRFQGSKLKIVDWIWDAMRDLQFESALDAFGGTGCVGYMLKSKGKQVCYNDVLKFNWYIGLALIENSSTKLSNAEVDFLTAKHRGSEYPTFVRDTFPDIYFTDEENSWIDMVAANIRMLEDRYKQAIAYFALFQACIIKRPFNLFHRKNLYIRFSDVDRNFGNKATWDTDFEVHFRKFVNEANSAAFSNGMENSAINMDVFDVPDKFDLVYIDTPYVSGRGVGVDYLGFYHFLEGLANYHEWGDMVEYGSRHRRLKGSRSVWTDKTMIFDAFDRLFRKFRDRILVVSYRGDGIPPIAELEKLLGKYKREVVELKRKTHKYVLSNSCSEEVLLIAR